MKKLAKNHINCYGKPKLFHNKNARRTSNSDSMESKAHMRESLYECLSETFLRKTHFTRTEAEQLLSIFKHLTYGQDKLDRLRFRDVLHNTFDMTDHELMDGVFRAFVRGKDSYISMSEWLYGLSIFCRGTLDEKIKFCFYVYDITGDGKIELFEVERFLRECIVLRALEEDSQEGIRDLVDLIVKKMDKDQDKQISFNDFKKSVMEDPLLLECFGQCLPDQKAKDAFLAVFSKDTAYFDKKLKF